MCHFRRDREAAMVTVRPNVFCDPCLVPLVRALWDAGLPTVASCCGHRRGPGSVILEDGRHLFIADEKWQAVIHEAIAEARCPDCEGQGEIPERGRESTNSWGKLAYFKCERCDGMGFLRVVEHGPQGGNVNGNYGYDYHKPSKAPAGFQS